MWGLWEGSLSQDQAREIAQRVCREKGWPFLDPVQVMGGLFSWTIRTNSRRIGSNAWITVNRKTGAVTRAGYNRR